MRMYYHSLLSQLTTTSVMRPYGQLKMQSTIARDGLRRETKDKILQQVIPHTFHAWQYPLNMFWAVEAPHHAEMRRKPPEIELGQHLYGRTQGDACAYMGRSQEIKSCVSCLEGNRVCKTRLCIASTICAQCLRL